MNNFFLWRGTLDCLLKVVKKCIHFDSWDHSWILHQCLENLKNYTFPPIVSLIWGSPKKALQAKFGKKKSGLSFWCTVDADEKNIISKVVTHKLSVFLWFWFVGSALLISIFFCLWDDCVTQHPWSREYTTFEMWIVDPGGYCCWLTMNWWWLILFFSEVRSVVTPCAFIPSLSSSFQKRNFLTHQLYGAKLFCLLFYFVVLFAKDWNPFFSLEFLVFELVAFWEDLGGKTFFSVFSWSWWRIHLWSQLLKTIHLLQA